MQNTLLMYLAGFFLVFLSCAIVCFCLRLVIWIYLDYCQPRHEERARARARERTHNRQFNRTQRDRQGNIYTISDDTLSASGNNYADFFYLEPSSEEAARIRAQLEKDDKELPSYDEVMGLNNLNAPTAAAAPTIIAGSSNQIGAADMSLPAVPPYAEIDPHASTASVTITCNATTTTTADALVTSDLPRSTRITIDGDPNMIPNSEATPSTSRAAAAASAMATTAMPVVSHTANSIV